MEWLFENQRTGLRVHFADDGKSKISITSVDGQGNATGAVEGEMSYGFDSAGRRSLGLIEVNPKEARGLGIGSAAMWVLAQSATEQGGINGASGDTISLVNADPKVRPWYGKLGFSPDPEGVQNVASEVEKLSEEHGDSIANHIAKTFLIPQVMMIAETRYVLQNSAEIWSKAWNVIGNSVTGGLTASTEPVAPRERLSATRLGDPAPVVQQGAPSNPNGLPSGERPRQRPLPPPPATRRGPLQH